MSPRTGRPPSKDPKKNDTRIRMTDAERNRLEYAAKVLGLTKADVIRQGIDIMYEKAQRKELDKT